MYFRNVFSNEIKTLLPELLNDSAHKTGSTPQGYNPVFPVGERACADVILKSFLVHLRLTSRH